MSKTFLIFGTALLALMAGALLYMAREAGEMEPPVAAAATTEASAEATESAAGEVTVYPAFSMTDMSGVTRDFDEWAGTHRIVNFWATWCAPCRREIPLLKALQDEHGKNGIQVIGIAVDFMDEVQAYAEAAEFNYPVLVGQDDAMALAETSGIDFIGLPFTMIVASDGELINAHMGEIHQDEIDHIVDVLGKLDRGDIDKPAAVEALKTL